MSKLKNLLLYKGHYLVLVVVLFVGIALCILIPPLQSPDEFDHLKRAYLWGHGKVLLDGPVGSSSGGMVDTGLKEYMSIYATLPFHRDVKLTPAMRYGAEGVMWSHQKVFDSAAGAVAYFPIIYTPQALALRVGEWLGLSIDMSYRGARYLNLIVIMLILIWAFSYSPPSYLAISCMLLPMQLFQLAATSIDGLAMALCIFAVSVFMRIAKDSGSRPSRDYYLLLLASTLLITSRPYLLPLLGLSLVVFSIRPSRVLALAIGCQAVFVIGWFTLVLLYTADIRVSTELGTVDKFNYYFSHPGVLMGVMWATMSDASLLQFYGFSFIGILGWLDTSLHEAAYIVLGLFLMLIAVLNTGTLRKDSQARWALLITALCSVALVFMLLLLTWTALPAVRVEGVQGRYLVIPFILVAYALNGVGPEFHARRIWLNIALLMTIGGYSEMVTIEALLDRYYGL